jgi:pimeloyl-ACP methyl ester carboxylesterase
MYGFGSLLPLLFAQPRTLPLQTPSCLLSTTVEQSSLIGRVDSTINNTSISTKQELSGSREIVNIARETYEDLSKGDIFIKSSPTIDFKFVHPPSKTETLSWCCNNPENLNIQGHFSDLQTLETVAASHETKKPVAIYLPGLDGTGISATQQFDDLAETFELWRMSIDQISDRSSFLELNNAAVDFITEIAKVEKGRKVVIIGESFGGLLAPSVALRFQAQAERTSAQNVISGMVLVNPATSFDETLWSTFVPLLASLRYLENEDENESDLPTPYSVLGGLALSATIPDSTQFGQILDQILKTQVRTMDDFMDTLTSMRDGFGILADVLPAEVIEHRVGKWLPVGTSVVNPRLSKLNVPTLVIAGEDDSMLPVGENKSEQNLFSLLFTQFVFFRC